MSDAASKSGRWGVWRTVRQNVEYEIGSAESDVAIHRSRLKEPSPETKQVLEECEKLIERARAANRFFPLGELLIYQLLFEVRRYLLLVQSIEEVEAKWSEIRRKLPELTKVGDLNS